MIKITKCCKTACFIWDSECWLCTNGIEASYTLLPFYFTYTLLAQLIIPSGEELFFTLILYLYSNGEVDFRFILRSGNFHENLIPMNEDPLFFKDMSFLEKALVFIFPKSRMVNATGVFFQRKLKPIPCLFKPSSLCEGGKLQNMIYEDRDWQTICLTVPKMTTSFFTSVFISS